MLQKKIDDVKRQFEYVLCHSLFYKEKFKDYKSSFSEKLFLGLPFTNKHELLYDQNQLAPFGGNLCVPVEKISRIHKTSGTTNEPLIVALTKKDIAETVRIGANCFLSSGLTREDVVIHCLNYNMWAGGYTDHQSLEKTGAAVIPYGVGQSKKLIETILLLKPTAIHCTPSYLKKLELILMDDFKKTPIELGLRLGLFGAESGLQNPLFRKKIEENWGLKAMNANYGLSEALSIIGSECKHQLGLHFWGLEYVYPELIDQQNQNNINIEPGAVGELVLTNLHKEAQPLIRYRTNDIIKVLSIGQCSCGYTGFTFEIVGRHDDMIVIKGVNVFVNAVGRLVSSIPQIADGVFELHVSRHDPIAEARLMVELADEGVCQEELKFHVMKLFKSELGFTPELVFYKNGGLPRTEGKSKNVFRTL